MFVSQVQKNRRSLTTTSLLLFKFNTVSTLPLLFHPRFHYKELYRKEISSLPIIIISITEQCPLLSSINPMHLYSTVCLTILDSYHSITPLTNQLLQPQIIHTTTHTLHGRYLNHPHIYPCHRESTLRVIWIGFLEILMSESSTTA